MYLHRLWPSGGSCAGAALQSAALPQVWRGHDQGAVSASVAWTYSTICVDHRRPTQEHTGGSRCQEEIEQDPGARAR